MSRPLQFRSEIEVRWAREWIRHQVNDGRMPYLFLKKIEVTKTADEFNDMFARELSDDQRLRLQKSLSARRARKKVGDAKRITSPSVRKVRMEVTENVRNMVLALAAARGVTSSELLYEYLDDDFSRLPL